MDIPAEVGHPSEVMSGWRYKKTTVPLTEDWKFGLPFRIESVLCQKFRQANCPSFAENQSCKIEFELVDNAKIKNVKVSRHSKAPAFEILAKNVILASNGSPEIRLPKSQRGTTVSVSSTFYKAETWRWVVVSLDNASSVNKSEPRIPDRADPNSYDFRMRQSNPYKRLPWPTDRQVIEYKNEKGETRFKLVPVDNSTR
jgi:hypothetical protein